MKRRDLMKKLLGLLGVCAIGGARAPSVKATSQKNDPETTIRLADSLQEMIDVQCSHGNWNYDSYMHGMANGMIFSKSVLTGKDPKYLDAPDRWLNAPPTIKTPKEAMDVLRCHLQSDPDYAWSWHCNIAMAAVDEGLDHDSAQLAAARFMRSAFSIDTLKPPYWQGNKA